MHAKYSPLSSADLLSATSSYQPLFGRLPNVTGGCDEEFDDEIYWLVFPFRHSYILY